MSNQESAQQPAAIEDPKMKEAAAGANAIHEAHLELTNAMQQTTTETIAELDQIIDTVAHARSTLPGSPSPADAAMGMITKMGKLATKIRDSRLPDMASSYSSTASVVYLALEQAQRAQTNALYSAKAAQDSAAEVHRTHLWIAQVISTLGLNIRVEDGVEVVVFDDERFSTIHEWISTIEKSFVDHAQWGSSGADLAKESPPAGNATANALSPSAAVTQPGSDNTEEDGAPDESVAQADA